MSFFFSVRVFVLKSVLYLILSEMSQKDKDKYHMISLITGISYPAQINISSEKKSMDLEKRLVAA